MALSSRTSSRDTYIINPICYACVCIHVCHSIMEKRTFRQKDCAHSFLIQVVHLVVQEDDQEKDLRNQLKNLFAELKSLNMVDQFAKYAKTERKINRLKEELSKISKFDITFLNPYYGHNVVLMVHDTSQESIP